jgi:hypothetical protein
MGGVACNGWRFWSLAGAEEAKPAKAPSKAKGKAKTKGKAKADANAEQPVACGECGAEFPNSREAAEHMRDEHNPTEAAGSGGR